MISISFSGIKMLCGWMGGGGGGGRGGRGFAPQSALFFIHFLIVDAPFPLPTAEKKNIHTLMCKHSQILLRQLMQIVAINAQTHLNALTHQNRGIYGKYFNNVLIFY